MKVHKNRKSVIHNPCCSVEYRMKAKNQVIEDTPGMILPVSSFNKYREVRGVRHSMSLPRVQLELCISNIGCCNNSEERE